PKNCGDYEEPGPRRPGAPSREQEKPTHRTTSNGREPSRRLPEAATTSTHRDSEGQPPSLSADRMPCGRRSPPTTRAKTTEQALSTGRLPTTSPPFVQVAPNPLGAPLGAPGFRLRHQPRGLRRCATETAQDGLD